MNESANILAQLENRIMDRLSVRGREQFYQITACTDLPASSPVGY